MADYKKSNNKENLLHQSNGGFDFYKKVIPDLELQDEESCRKTRNPFYTDSKPSLSVYFNSKTKRWNYKDFGDESYQGDVFEFASHYYGLDVTKDFYKILTMMADDLGLKLETNISTDNVVNIFGHKLYFTGSDGYADSYNYFKQFGITESTLREYKVKAIYQCDYTDKEGTLKSRYFKDKDVVIAYEDIYFSKIYCPNPKSFFYIGSKEKDFVFGLKQIFNRSHKKKSFRETLILTGGEKDVLTLTSLGFDAVSLNSETASVPKKLTEEVFFAYKNIVVLYDIDETGQRRAQAIAEELDSKFNVVVCNLPSNLSELGGKDVSDYMRLGLDADNLKKLIVNVFVNSELSESTKVPIQQTKSQIDSKDMPYLLDSPTLDKSFEIGTMEDTPVFPDSLYQKLPKFLKEISLQFSDPRERDIIFLSTLGVTSSFFPKVKGHYGQSRVAANLYFFISAPASNGKGVMVYARELGSRIQKALNMENIKQRKKYLLDKAYYIANIKKEPKLEKPEEPNPKSMFIPANTSASMMIQLLGENKNFGVMFESEGDTLTASLKTDWGNTSDMLRKAAHHETISMARRQDNEFIEIQKPCLSVVLSGTPNQIGDLVQSVENGLVSRFSFYDFKSKVTWKNQFVISNSEKEAFFRNAADYLFKLWEKQSESKYTTVIMPENQFERINAFFEAKLHSLHLNNGDDIVASVRRHGLTFYRIAMLLSIFRTLESNEWLPVQVIISEQDIENALVIIETLLVHLVKVFKRIEGGALLSKLNSKQRGLLEALPEEFSKKVYTEVRITQGLKEDAAEKYIRDLIKAGAISRVDQGEYRKVA